MSSCSAWEPLETDDRALNMITRPVHPSVEVHPLLPIASQAQDHGANPRRRRYPRLGRPLCALSLAIHIDSCGVGMGRNHGPVQMIQGPVQRSVGTGLGVHGTGPPVSDAGLAPAAKAEVDGLSGAVALGQVTPRPLVFSRHRIPLRMMRWSWLGLPMVGCHGRLSRREQRFQACPLPVNQFVSMLRAEEETTMQTCTSVASAQRGGLYVSVYGAQPGAEHERRGAGVHQGSMEPSSNDPVDG